MADETGKGALAPASLLAQSLGWIDPATKAIVPPIHLSSTFLRDKQ